MTDLKVLIPVIRKKVASLIAEEIVGVQPMAEDAFIGDSIFSFNMTDEIRPDNWGNVIHDFIRGYCIYDGYEFINWIEFIDLYGSKGITDDAQRERFAKAYYGLKGYW